VTCSSEENGLFRPLSSGHPPLTQVLYSGDARIYQENEQQVLASFSCKRSLKGDHGCKEKLSRYNKDSKVKALKKRSKTTIRRRSN
jgi:hypothetical protein